MKSIILFPALLALHTNARPLIFERPFYETFKTVPPQPEDNPYGPMEVPADYGNYFHREGDNIHTDDLWPPLVPPRAVRRAEPAKVLYEPTPTPDIVAPYRPICHRCPPGVAPLPVPSLKRRDDLNSTSTGAPVVIATGAQQWQQYWAHDAAVSPVHTPTVATSTQFSKISTTGEPTAILTGAEQWQVYWSHGRSNTGLLTDKAKFDLFVKIFTLPRHLTSAIISLAEHLAQFYPHSLNQGQETEAPGTNAIIAMCDTLGQNFPHGKIEKELTKEMGAAITTTCKSLAGLFPESKIQTCAANFQTENPFSRRRIVLPPPDADFMEAHTEDTGATTNVSPSASAHRPKLGVRGMYMFQPLEEAYNWLNGIYSRVINQHPRWPYNNPEEHIFGCIYVPSWDTVAKDQIICPPGGRDGEQGVDARSYTETNPGMVKRSDADEVVEGVEDAVEVAVETVVNIAEAFIIGKRSITEHPEALQKHSVDFSLINFFEWLFGAKIDEDPFWPHAENQNQNQNKDAATPSSENREISLQVQKHNLTTWLIWFYTPKHSDAPAPAENQNQEQNENQEAATPAPKKRSVSGDTVQKRTLVTFFMWLFTPNAKPEVKTSPWPSKRTSALLAPPCASPPAPNTATPNLNGRLSTWQPQTQ